MVLMGQPSRERPVDRLIGGQYRLYLSGFKFRGNIDRIGYG